LNVYQQQISIMLLDGGILDLYLVYEAVFGQTRPNLQLDIGPQAHWTVLHSLHYNTGVFGEKEVTRGHIPPSFPDRWGRLHSGRWALRQSLQFRESER
jgi:hypothetical protein